MQCTSVSVERRARAADHRVQSHGIHLPETNLLAPRPRIEAVGISRPQLWPRHVLHHVHEVCKGDQDKTHRNPNYEEGIVNKTDWPTKL